MSDIKFTVCIPVYNADMYLKECIDSVVNQSYKNFELILVDDGSTDSSGVICDEYKEKFDYITVYHNENRGMLYSRKYAYERGKGEYCVFVDADDFIEPDTLKKLSEIIDKENCDMVVYNYRRFHKNKEEDIDIIWNEYKVFETAKEKEEYYKKFLFTSKLNTLWRKTVKTRLLLSDTQDHEKDIRIRNGEDFLLSLYPTFNADKIVYTPEVFYNYRFNPEGVSQVFNPGKTKSIALVRSKGLLYLENSSLKTEENIYKYREHCFNILMDMLKEISCAPYSFKEKTKFLGELRNNEFFKEFVIEKSDLIRKSKSDKIICKLFAKRNYNQIITIIKLYKIFMKIK